MLLKREQEFNEPKTQTKIPTLPSCTSTNSPARWINKKKKGRLSPSTHIPHQHHFLSTPSAMSSPTVTLRSQNLASILPLGPSFHDESSTGRVLEHLSNSLPTSSRALKVVPGADLLSNGHTLHISRSDYYSSSSRSIAHLFRGHRSLVCPP